MIVVFFFFDPGLKHSNNRKSELKRGPDIQLLIHWNEGYSKEVLKIRSITLKFDNLLKVA